MNISEIILNSFQEEHLNKIKDIFKYHSFAIDKSKTGSGKSIIASKFIQESSIKNGIIVCSVSIENDWKNRIIKYNLPISYIISYETLRGKKDSMPNHNLLLKDIDGNFYPTDYLIDMIKQGFILILDEFQRIKNNTDQTKAVKAISKYITQYNKENNKIISYIYCISYSPFDTEETCVNFFYTVGIILNPLFDRNTKKLIGIYELIEYTNKFNKEKTNYILSKNEITSKTTLNVCYQLCVDILLPIISSYMIIEENIFSKQSIYYGYFNIPDEGHNLIKSGINMIHNSKKKEKKFVFDNQISKNLYKDFSNGDDIDDMSGIIHGMITIQATKTKYILVDAVKKCFESIKNVKVVLFFDNKIPLNLAMKELSMYNPIDITGNRNKEDRTQIISKFQEANLDSRLLLFISKIGSEGIELDDQDGNYPRVGFGIPGYSMIQMLQIPGRLNRFKTKSNSLFFWIYSISDEYCEQSVINSINRKSKVLTDINNDMIIPYSYKKIFGDEIYDLNKLLIDAGNEIYHVEKKEEKIETITIFKSSFPSLF